MNDPIIKYPLMAGTVSIIVKLVYFNWFYGSETIDMSVRLSYLFIFLTALLFGFREWKANHPNQSFTTDLKSTLKITAIYALIMTGFTWLYYRYIDFRFFEQKIATALTAAEGEPAEVLANIEETANFIFSPFTHSTITLMGIMVIGLFYGIIAVALVRWKPSLYGIK